MLQWPHVFSHHHTLPVLSLLNNIFSDAKRTWLYRKVKKKFAKRPNLPFHFKYLAKEMGYLCIKLILDLPHRLTQLWRSPPCSRVCFSSQSWTAKQTFKVWAAKLCQRLQARLPLVLFPPPAPSCALMWTCCFATHNHLVRNTLGTFFFVGRWFVSTCNVFLISRNIKYVLDCLRVFHVCDFHSVVRHSSSFAQ